jgi:hypothetical protein
MSVIRAQRLVTAREASFFLALLLAIVALASIALPHSATAQEFTVTRLNEAEPIISQSDFRRAAAGKSDGRNINGPSVIRIPDWIPPEKRAAPGARFYLYFAHHKGAYIRLAWAEEVQGPWHLYNVAADIPQGRRGVLDIGDDRELAFGNSLSITRHVASPDVHIDNEHKRIVMYFHGGIDYAGDPLPYQYSMVATSPWGLDFSAGIEPVLLSNSYLRVFDYNGSLHGLISTQLLQPPDQDAPWSPAASRSPAKGVWNESRAAMLDFSKTTLANGEKFAPGRTIVRHMGLYLSGSDLTIFFTMKEHAPERILAIKLDLKNGCWYCAIPNKVPTEVMRPQEPWEGSELTPSPSKNGASKKLENALRDPYIFEDQGILYLFYAGGGERGIGLARLDPIPNGHALKGVLTN